MEVKSAFQKKLDNEKQREVKSTKSESRGHHSDRDRRQDYDRERSQSRRNSHRKDSRHKREKRSRSRQKQANTNCVIWIRHGERCDNSMILEE